MQHASSKYRTQRTASLREILHSIVEQEEKRINNMGHIYCNVAAIELAGNHGINPITISKVLWLHTASHCIAEYSDKDFKLLDQIAEKEYEDADAWWREVNRANFGLDEEEGMYGTGYKPRIARKVGLLLYICDQFQASTEKNVAAMIGELAHHEAKDPIEFFNSFTKL